MFFRSVENIFQPYEVLTILICILFLIVLLPLCPPTLFAFCLHFIIITFTLNDELVICSLNVRGLSNPLERRETFRWLKMKKYGIFFLQEVHCTKEKESLWTSEWGFTAFFSSFSSASAGVCILFNNNFQFEIIRQFSDQEGRYIIIDMKIDNKILILVNIYAPNNDNPTFFQNLLDQILSFECEEVIMGGDFNLVMDDLGPVVRRPISA